MAAYAAERARALPVEGRRSDRGARGRAGAARDPGQRQAIHGEPPRRHPGRGRDLPLLRRLGEQDLRRDEPLGRDLLQLHPPRAGGRVRADHPVELSAPHGGVEARAGARLRQHQRAEARGADAAHRAPAGRAAARGGAPRRRREHRPRLRRDRRARDRPSPDGRQDRVHGVHRGRQGDPPGDFRDAQARVPGARVQGALLGVFFCAGQVCCAGTRLFVEQKMHDEIAQKLAKSAAGMKQGNPFDADTRIGPLVSQEQLERVTGYLEIGKKEGAKPLIGGERNMAKGLEKGYYVKPTVFTGVRNDMKIAREEIFGPVVSVIPFKDEHDAVLQGNDTTYGLAAGIWTRDVSKAHRVARALRAGTVWVNCYNVFDPAAPFGGYKESGYGRELGRYALDLYTQVKSVWLKI